MINIIKIVCCKSLKMSPLFILKNFQLLIKSKDSEVQKQFQSYRPGVSVIQDI